MASTVPKPVRAPAEKSAVVITVLTGSLISALSLGLMLLVSRQLRVGLFELSKLQNKIKLAEKELIQRENNLIAFIVFK